MIRVLLLLFALFQIAPASPGNDDFFQFRRSVTPPSAGQTCVVLDASVFAHAEPFLKDLRLAVTDAAGTRDLPYVITLSEAQQSDSEPAPVLNLGTRGQALSFDLQMPPRPYTEVRLDLAAQDFLATAVVTGIQHPGDTAGTALGSFTLFDLTSQHLARNTVLHLQESTFPYLHVTLTASPSGGGSSHLTAPSILRGATVPPSREAQTLFTVAAQTSAIEQRPRQSLARLQIPQRVPIERVSFRLDPAFHANFSRDVLVSSHALGAPANSGDSVQGTIQHVDLTEAQREIHLTELSLPAILGANLQSPAEVDVAVQNGDDAPIPITAVQLEMRRRALCFQSLDHQQFTLFYGDPQLDAPVYDLARTYTPAAHSTAAVLGPEEPNPGFHPRPDVRPFTERHPHLLWIALLLTVCVLALVAFRSAHPQHHNPHA